MGPVFSTTMEWQHCLLFVILRRMGRYAQSFYINSVGIHSRVCRRTDRQGQAHRAEYASTEYKDFPPHPPPHPLPPTPRLLPIHHHLPCLTPLYPHLHPVYPPSTSVYPRLPLRTPRDPNPHPCGSTSDHTHNPLPCGSTPDHIPSPSQLTYPCITPAIAHPDTSTTVDQS